MPSDSLILPDGLGVSAEARLACLAGAGTVAGESTKLAEKKRREAPVNHCALEKRRCRHR